VNLISSNEKSEPSLSRHKGEQPDTLYGKKREEKSHPPKKRGEKSIATNIGERGKSSSVFERGRRGFGG